MKTCLRRVWDKILECTIGPYLADLVRTQLTRENCSLESAARRLAAEDAARIAEKLFLDKPYFADRLEFLRHALKAVSIAGTFLEFGVYKGETINIIAEEYPEAKVHGFDSFEGLPEDWIFGLKKGAFSTHGTLPAVRANVSLIKGLFDQTLPEFVKANPRTCAFLHVDSDLYASCKTILDLLEKQIQVGTVIVFDEYFNYWRWQLGEYKAFNEFVAKHGVTIEYLGYSEQQLSVKITKIDR